MSVLENFDFYMTTPLLIYKKNKIFFQNSAVVLFFLLTHYAKPEK